MSGKQTDTGQTIIQGGNRLTSNEEETGAQLLEEDHTL